MNKKHLMSTTRFYNIFYMMKARCSKKYLKDYKYYGEKGIKVCWKSFEQFKEDMYPSYLAHSKKFGESNTTIDRINGSKNYKKANCRWATKQLQSRNRKTSIIIDGKIIAEWSDILGIKRITLYSRIRRGWPKNKILIKV